MLILLFLLPLTLAFQPSFLPATHRQWHKPLFNFLDDYKDGQIEESEFPQAICESDVHQVRFSTTAGDFTVTIDRALSPSGVGRFLELVDDGFFNDQLMYRVRPGFVIQFGVAADPIMHTRWDPQRGSPVPSLPDEPNRAKFRGGTLSFAGKGIDSRCCHFFLALEPYGVDLGEAPHESTLGWVETEDLSLLDRIVGDFKEAGYPDLTGLQDSLMTLGNEAAADYPRLHRIIDCGRL